jgi:putative flavoprotein involved in K+ transport
MLRLTAKERAMSTMQNRTEYINTIVIGSGQAGLSIGYHLKERKMPFLILEANGRVGDSWRKRWDSLRLFTPARFDGIDGMKFPASPSYFPTKDEMADFLEDYATRYELPVRTGTRVESLSRSNGRFRISSGDHMLEADNVVVAMADYQKPRIPPFAGELDPDIVHLHSSAYRNPSQLQEGSVLVVGAGNSGAEISMEVVRTHETWMAGRDVGHLPFNIAGLAAHILLQRLVLRLLFHRVLTVGTPLGRKVRPKILMQGGPLIRQRPAGLAAAGVKRVPRVGGVTDGKPVTEDGQILNVRNVIWCTGFHPGFSWIDLPIHAEHEPRHHRGIVEKEPGLYFVGLHFLYSLSSTMIHGVGRDAEYIADAIARRANGRTAIAAHTHR